MGFVVLFAPCGIAVGYVVLRVAFFWFDCIVIEVNFRFVVRVGLARLFGCSLVVYCCAGCFNLVYFG